MADNHRRKYRKIMVVFEDKMRESNTLYREHQRILNISRRLSEQNEYVLTNIPVRSCTDLLQVNYSSCSTISTKLLKYHPLIATIFNLQRLQRENVSTMNKKSCSALITTSLQKHYGRLARA